LGACGSARAPADKQTVASDYLAIATPANDQLDHAVDGFTDHKRQDLAAALTDLRDEASIERKFDRDLLGIKFRAPLDTIAGRLVRANEARAQLALQAAKSTSLVMLASFGPAQKGADAEVEDQVRLIRRGLRLPPPDQS
jgi:hypothetical protein